MDQQTFELLRVLQSGERSEQGLAQVRSLLDPQRRALHAADDRASLSDISELLEVWAESAPPPQAAAAIAHAGQIAEQDLEQAERAVQLYIASLERDPTQSKVVDQLDGLLKQLRQRERLDAVLVKMAAALRAQGDAGADAAATTLRRLGQLRVQLGTSIDGAVSAYEQALELSAEVELIRELAELYAKRNVNGDARQAADLYATLAEVLGAQAGKALLERALDLVPGHLEALSLLESFVPEAKRAERLAPRWAAFVNDSDDIEAAAQRRSLLARAALKSGDHHAALEWIGPNADQGDHAALDLQASALAALAQADGAAATPAASPAASPVASSATNKSGKKAPVRPSTLVGFRVPVGSRTTEAEQANAPGARKPRKPRSGDTIVGFRVPEALAATAAERTAHAASSKPSPSSAAASKAAALKPAAGSAKPTAGAKSGAASANGGKPATANAPASKNASTATASKPAARSSAAGAKPAASQPAIGARAPRHEVAATAPLSPAQRSAALRTGGSAGTLPAASAMAISATSASAPSAALAATFSPAAALAATLRASSAPPVAAAPTPTAIAQSPAAALASSLQARASSSPPPLAPRLSHMSGAAPASSAAAQAQVLAPTPAAAPLPVAMPAPRKSEGDRRDDDLSGVRARPQFLDKRTLAIGGAVLLGVIGAVMLLRAKPAPTPPAASADAAQAVEAPPSAAPSSATPTAVATGTTSAPAAPSAAAPTGSALPSSLAAAITPPVTTAPAAAVAPEPTTGRVEVQVSEIRVRGGKLRTKDVLTALGAGLKDVEHCYEEVLEDHPRTAGALNYSFTVDRKGNPTKIKKAGGTIKDSRLLKCTQRAIEKADFPKPKSKPAQVTLPLEFKKS
ncbi:MAG TPA: AgmX/PglI C-terminal domain-containing protein [Polyangiales bacterium]|nr:AgmX/PglI C-terminal domain-containing protein [Polyangiales bacterium]